MEERKIEVLKGDIWERKEFYELREMDIFRMFEATGGEVVDDCYKTVFRAKSNPFGSDGQWVIEAE